jgi:hypothetical protein
MLHYISVACSPTHVRRHILVNTVSVAPVHGSHTPAACVCVSQLTTHTPAARVCVCLSHRLTARTHLLRACVCVCVCVCVCASQLTTHTPAARVCVCLSHRLTARTHLLRVCVCLSVAQAHGSHTPAARVCAGTTSCCTTSA